MLYFRNIFIFLLLLNGVVNARNNVHIVGFARGAEGRDVRIVVYKDYISYTEKILSSTRVNENGRFELHFRLEETSFAFLEIENNRAEIYLRPHTEYNIEVLPSSLNFDKDPLHPLFKLYTLRFVVDEGAEKGLNQQIQDFNLYYNNYVIENFDVLYGRRNFDKIDSIFNMFAGDESTQDQYFRNYVTYRLANLEMLTYSRRMASIVITYFRDKKIQYHHIEYMSFFNELFNRYLLTSSRAVNVYDLDTAVNFQKDYLAIFNLMGQDSLLVNEQFRELVMLKSLSDMYYEEKYKQEAIEDILKDFSQKTVFNEHRYIADNLLQSLTVLSKGSPLPDLQLSENVGLYDDFNDNNYLYMCFLSTSCELCLTEMILLEELQKKYKEDLTVIAVFVDEEKPSFEHFMYDKNYDFPVFYYENQPAILEKYQLRFLPLFVFADRNKKIIQYPAFMPGENIEFLIKKYLAKEKGQ